MKTQPTFISMVAARAADPESFDAAVRNAVMIAARQLDQATVIRALCGPSVKFQAVRELKAA